MGITIKYVLGRGMNDTIELLVNIHGFAPQVGIFKRDRPFHWVLDKPISWKAERDGGTSRVSVQPINQAWRVDGPLNVATWVAGSTITLKAGAADIEDPQDALAVQFGLPPSARPGTETPSATYST